MNEKNGDVTVNGAERPYSDLAEWAAQVKMASGLAARVTLCFAFGEPSTVDLKDADETIEVLHALVKNLRGEAERRWREVQSR